MIMRCVSGCKSKFQDARYGKDRRVHNPTIKGFRCTVCGTERDKVGQKIGSKK